jgi:hypothetical protein
MNSCFRSERASISSQFAGGGSPVERADICAMRSHRVARAITVLVSRSHTTFERTLASLSESNAIIEELATRDVVQPSRAVVTSCRDQRYAVNRPNVSILQTRAHTRCTRWAPHCGAHLAAAHKPEDLHRAPPRALGVSAEVLGHVLAGGDARRSASARCRPRNARELM